jgi:glycosyltransferase involved in cell wall biosynthesis
MRVAVDARALGSGRGVARWVHGVLGALADAHPEDEWVALVPGRAPVADPPAGVVLVRTALPSRSLHGAAALAGRPRIAALAGGADVVWLPAPAPAAPGAPYVLSVHDRSWERRPGDFTRYERAWHAVARPRARARRAAAITAVSHAVADELVASWGVHATVVSPGIAPATTVTPRPGRYLLWVGALEPRKAPEVMAAAFAAARARGLDADLVVVGAGRTALGGDGVRAVESPDDSALAGLYAGALAVVTPSLLEGFGLPALEAAAHGTPAVVSDLPCFAETLGDAALRVPPGDAGALADALLAVAGDPALRERLGSGARTRAAAYTWAGAAAALYPLLAEAAE